MAPDSQRNTDLGAGNESSRDIREGCTVGRTDSRCQGPVPVLELGPRVSAPQGLFEDIVRSNAPQAQIGSYGGVGAIAGHDDKRLLGFVNPITGESTICPLIESLQPGRN